MKNDRPSLTSWLGFRDRFDFRKSRSLGLLLGNLLVLGAIFLVAFSVYGFALLFGALIGQGPFAGDATAAAIRNLGLVIAAVVGLPFLVWRSFVAQRNADTAEQSQITDRINRAVLGLGSEKVVKRVIDTPLYKQDDDGNWLRDEDGGPIPAERPDGTPLVKREEFEATEPNIEVRVGAILSLERIARDSESDYRQVLDLLCTYVRENSGRKPSDDLRRREDIQAAIQVIGNRSGDLLRDYVPDLIGTNLSRLNFTDLNFQNAFIGGANLSDAHLAGADFSFSRTYADAKFSNTFLADCNFSNGDFHYVDFFKASAIDGADFTGAELHRCKFSKMKFARVSFANAWMLDCDFSEAEVAKCSFDRVNMSNTNFRDAFLISCSFKNLNSEFVWSTDFDQTFGVSKGIWATTLPDGVEYPSRWLDCSKFGTDIELEGNYGALVVAFDVWRSGAPIEDIEAAFRKNLLTDDLFDTPPELLVDNLKP